MLLGEDVVTHEHLPPRELWLRDPNKWEDKIVVPTDSRGLVTVNDFIQEVKDSVDPSHKWTGKLMVHHFCYPEWLYQAMSKPDSAGDALVFRELAINKGLMPEDFEDFLHLISCPPSVPNPEVRQYCIEAWEVATSLFRKAKDYILWEKRELRRRQYIEKNPHIVKAEYNGEDVIGKAYLEQRFIKDFEGLDWNLQRNEQIPPEFRIIHGEDPAQITRQLGRIVSKGSLDLVRQIKRAA